MNEDKIIDALNHIDDNLIADAALPVAKKHKAAKRIGAVCAAAVICFCSVVPALAAKDVKPAYDLIYSISPELAQRLKPVKKSCVSNGIQMEVTSADVHGSKAEILVALKDLENDRLDETVDLFDSYNIKGIKDCFGTCRLESYDKNSGIASFLIYIEQMNSETIDLDKITFSLSKILTKKVVTEGKIDGIDLSNVNRNPKVIYKSSRGEPFGKFRFLKPESSPIYKLAGGAEISALGYIDTELHIQVKYDDIISTDNHGFLYLKNADGETIEGVNDSFFGENKKDSYEEYSFPVSYKELQNYELYGEITTCDSLYEGDWEITFSLDEMR